MAIIEIHVHQEADPEISQKLDQVLAALAVIQQKETQMGAAVDALNAQIDALAAQVETNTTVEQAALTLIGGLSSQLASIQADITAAGGDATKVQALKDKLDSSAQALAAAVAANTTAAPAPVAPDAPTP